MYSFFADTVPIKNGWLDRLYEEVEYSSDFWMKGITLLNIVIMYQFKGAYTEGKKSHWIIVTLFVDVQNT
jgi:hypothetical protein